MPERPTLEELLQEEANASEIERFQAICREEAGLGPAQLQEVRLKRCLDHYNERVRAISRRGVEARRRKAAERKAAQAKEAGRSAATGQEARDPDDKEAAMARTRKTRGTTRRSLPRTLPLLVGRVRTMGGRPPAMQIEVWCPFCKSIHVHCWSPEDRRADHVEHRVAHCLDGSPFRDGGYYVGLDTEARKGNATAFADHDRLAAAGCHRGGVEARSTA